MSEQGPMSSAPLVAPSGELSTAVGAAEAQAEVQARYVMAVKMPRDIDVARARILKDCKRPRFAEAALYALPRGGTTITGPSIRMIEAVLRNWGNIYSKTLVTHDSADSRKIRNFVTDLETNVTFDEEMIVPKTMERKRIRDGVRALYTRQNHKGETLYILPASPDEVRQLQGAMVSRAIRNNGKRIIPADILGEAIDIVNDTRRSQTAQDPDKTRKDLADGFATLNISADDLKLYLKHPLDKCTPAELDDLRLLFVALREGNTNWHEVLVEAGVISEAESPDDLAGAATKLREERGA